MKLGRFAIPIIAILAIVAVGAATSALVVAARSQQPQTLTPPAAGVQQPPEPPPAAPAQAEPPDKPTPAHAPTTGGDASSKPTFQSTGQAWPKPPTGGPGPKPTPKPMVNRGPKGNRAPPGPVQGESSQAVPRAGDAGGKGPAQGTVYTWQDGDRAMRVVLQEDLVAQQRSANTPHGVVIAGGGRNSIVKKQDKRGSEAQPVFRSESGGGLMTLPGGVMLALDPEWDQAAVDKFFAGNDIPADRVTPLEFLDNGFFVETEPGFPSLELANVLASQEGVMVSSPNWWRDMKAK